MEPRRDPKMHEEIKDEEAKEGRDLLLVKKGFGTLPSCDGEVDKYDDWRFKVVTLEENFKDFVEWTEKRTPIPGKKNLHDWEFRKFGTVL